MAGPNVTRSIQISENTLHLKASTQICATDSFVNASHIQNTHSSSQLQHALFAHDQQFEWDFHLTEMLSDNPRHLVLFRSLVLGLLGVVDSLSAQKQELFTILRRKDFIILDLRDVYGDAEYCPQRYRSEFKQFVPSDWEEQWKRTKIGQGEDIATVVERAMSSSQSDWGWHASGDQWTGSLSIKKKNKECASNTVGTGKEEAAGADDSFFDSFESPFISFTSVASKGDEGKNHIQNENGILTFNVLDEIHGLEQYNGTPIDKQEPDKVSNISRIAKDTGCIKEEVTSGSETEDSIHTVEPKPAEKPIVLKTEIPKVPSFPVLPQLPSDADLVSISKLRKDSKTSISNYNGLDSDPYSVQDDQESTQVLFPRFSSQGFYSDDINPFSSYNYADSFRTGGNAVKMSLKDRPNRPKASTGPTGFKSSGVHHETNDNSQERCRADDIDKDKNTQISLSKCHPDLPDIDSSTGFDNAQEELMLPPSSPRKYIHSSQSLYVSQPPFKDIDGQDEAVSPFPNDTNIVPLPRATTKSVQAATPAEKRLSHFPRIERNRKGKESSLDNPQLLQSSPGPELDRKQSKRLNQPQQGSANSQNIHVSEKRKQDETKLEIERNKKRFKGRIKRLI